MGVVSERLDGPPLAERPRALDRYGHGDRWPRL